MVSARNWKRPVVPRNKSILRARKSRYKGVERRDVRVARMEAMVDLTATQLSAYSRLFSSAVVRELAGKKKSVRFCRLAQESGVLDRVKRSARVADVFDAAFDVLKQGGLRDAYIYKAALTHRVLLGTHNLKTASMLTEFRAGECKADIAILNGTVTVYEIKSERDSLARLANQIRNYQRVFAKIFVIVGESHVTSVIRATPSEVGVMSLSRRYQISTVREAVDCPDRISPLTVFESLRVAEAKDIVTRLGQAVPDVPNTEMHSALRSIFEGFEPRDVHDAMLQTLKKSRSLLSLSSLVESLPYSLQPAALTVPLRKADHQRLVAALETPLAQARGWA